MNGACVDLIIVSCVVALFLVCDPLYELGIIMKFRIIQKHDGTDYYYIVEQCNWGRWKRCTDSMLWLPFCSCKKAEIALDNWYMKSTVNNVIIEKTF